MAIGTVSDRGDHVTIGGSVIVNRSAAYKEKASNWLPNWLTMNEESEKNNQMPFAPSSRTLTGLLPAILPSPFPTPTTLDIKSSDRSGTGRGPVEKKIEKKNTATISAPKLKEKPTECAVRPTTVQQPHWPTGGSRAGNCFSSTTTEYFE